MTSQSYHFVNRQIQNLTILVQDQNGTNDLSNLDYSVVEHSGFPPDYPIYEDYGGASFFETYFSKGKATDISIHFFL